MALITTTGGANSNSFVTLAEAEERIAAMSYDTKSWFCLSTTAKEDCLTLAAYALSRLPFRGRKVNRRTVVWDNMDGTTTGESRAEQALAFPRTVQHIKTVIPDEVKQCQIDVAATIIAPTYPPVGDSTSDAAGATANLRDIQKFRIGPMSVTLNSKPQETSLEYKLSAGQLLSSHVVSLRLHRFLTSIVGRRVDTYDEYYNAAEDDRITTTTTTSTTTTTTTV
jgi:hypothetical protein